MSQLIIIFVTNQDLIFKCLSGSINLYKFVKKHSINIIHSHHHYAASIAMAISRITKINTILTNHGLLPEIGFLNHFNAHHIIVVNKHIKEYLIRESIKKKREVSFIPHGFPFIGCFLEKIPND